MFVVNWLAEIETSISREGAPAGGRGRSAAPRRLHHTARAPAWPGYLAIARRRPRQRGPGRDRDQAAPESGRDQANRPSTSSYEPSEYRPIPIAKYAITRAGNNR